VVISDVNTVFEKYPDLAVTFFADDGTISSPKLDTLQAALTDLVPYLAERGLSINASNIKIMKFRKGGRTAKTDELSLG
jgi:hypothetical protein